MQALTLWNMATTSTNRDLVSLPGQISLFANREVPDPFRKAVEILHNKPKAPLTLLQRKLFNALVKHAIEKPADDRGWWSITLRSLQVDVGFDSNNREYLKESARALMAIVFEWDQMAPQTKRGAWKASVMFPEVELHPDQMKFQVSSHLRELMLKPDIYAMIDMSIVRRFRRGPSLAIWEFCVRYEKIGRSAEVQWRIFRDMVLGETADSKTYQEYKHFKSKVLNTSIAEINSESNLTIDLVETKIGRSVATIRFDIARKHVDTEVIESGADLELLGELIKLGVMQSEAKKLLKQHPVEQLRATLEYTRRRQADKRGDKLANPAAYFRHALANGYATVEVSAAAQEGRTTAGATAEGQSARSKKLDLREAFMQARSIEAEGYFKELDAADQALLIERYNSQQTLAALRLSGKRVSKASEIAFKRWLAMDLWGEPGAEQLLEFAQSMLARQA
jgi:hypothetical protein